MYTACLQDQQKYPLCKKCTHVVLSLQVWVLIRRPRRPGHPLGTEVPGRRGVGPTLCTARRGPVRELRAERITSHHAVRDRLQHELAKGLANCNGLEPRDRHLHFVATTFITVVAPYQTSQSIINQYMESRKAQLRLRDLPSLALALPLSRAKKKKEVCHPILKTADSSSAKEKSEKRLAVFPSPRGVVA